jgi:hypothetical protein
VRLESDEAATVSHDRARFAVRLGVDPETFTVERRGRIPFVVAAGSAAPIDLSLSHHGRVVGFAALVAPRGRA